MDVNFAFKKYCEQSQIYCLQLGSAKNALDGWFNTDIVEQPKLNIFKLDARQKFPFNDNIFDYIFSEHMIEHLNYTEQKQMLSECYRVLKPNGVLRISCPTLDNLIDMLKNENADLVKEYIVNFHCKFFDKKLLNDFDTPPFSLVFNNFMRMWGHKNILDKNALVKMLTNAGFKNIEEKEYGQSNISQLTNIEMHGRQAFKKMIILETSCFESTK